MQIFSIDMSLNLVFASKELQDDIIAGVNINLYDFGALNRTITITQPDSTAVTNVYNIKKTL
ncbi:MAG: hypothetical protein JXR36_00820 [Bacteroidales bacterium]|nr:hypothetical protein [Bacteroidales bacterium]